MSFTNQVIGEILTIPSKKTCCRKAFLMGLSLACRSVEKNEKKQVLYFYNQEAAEMAKESYGKVFRSEGELSSIVRAGRKTFALTFSSGAIGEFLRRADEGLAEAAELIGFRCPACIGDFLRGAFLGSGTVTDPHKGYHLELSFPTGGRAALIGRLLEEQMGKPGCITRGERCGVYYKSNGAVSDFLYLIGCTSTSFDVANACIERDIRNSENRATNCVARNISRSVEAAQRQICAIEKLYVSRKIDTLSDELRETARLRMENESASLLELALLHQPPISKSGLNRRLSRLLEEAEETNL